MMASQNFFTIEDVIKKFPKTLSKTSNQNFITNWLKNTTFLPEFFQNILNSYFPILTYQVLLPSM